MTSLIHIGTSGYQYDHWQDVFYPQKLPKKDRFKYYTKFFDTVEINNTFYNLPSEKTFDQWRRDSPAGFCYALKYSRYGTHMKRLKDPENHSSRFLERAEHLKQLLGPILVQLRPDWKRDPQRLAGFLKAVPDHRRWAIEVRDPDWFQDQIYQILRQYNAPLVIHDMIPEHPRILTADWVYMRFHGRDYGGSYDKNQLLRIAEQIKEYAEQQMEVYLYFNNDAEGHAVKNALSLKEIVN